MITKNIKIALFGALMVAMILPFSGIGFVSAEVPGKATQIQKPVDSQFERDSLIKVKELFVERMALESEGQNLKDKYQQNGNESLTTSDIEKLDSIQKRLSEISAEIGTISADTRKLYAATPEERNNILNQKQLVRDSNIPYVSLGTDMRVGALTIGFETQEQADKFIPKINQILSIPYYVEIGEYENFGCTYLTSNCNPLMGGIEIETEKSSSWTNCSIGVPIYRNVYWWTEEGFVTAAHCFDNTVGNDARQPSGSSNKVGDVTKTQHSGECDCAFVKKSSSESTLFGNWWGTSSSNQLYSKGDPQLYDYVVMIGKNSGIQIGQVISLDLDAGGVDNMHKVNYAMQGGDSGGTVIDLTTYNVYQGLIQGGVPGSYTGIVPWSHIDAALDLQ